MRAAVGSAAGGWGCDEKSLPAGGAGGLIVVGVAVADVEDGLGREGEGLGDGAEGARVGFFEADFAGDEDVMKARRPTQAVENGMQARVPVGEDVEGRNGAGRVIFKEGDGAGERAPAAVVGEFEPEFGKDGVEDFLGAFGSETAVGEFAPEGALGGFVDDGEQAGAQVGEGVVKAGVNDFGIGSGVVAREDFGVDVAGARVRVEEGAADVEGDGAHAGEVNGDGRIFHATAQRARRRKRGKRF